MGRITLLLGVLFWAKAVFAADGDLPRTLDELNHWYVEPSAGSNAATKFLEGAAALKITDADTTSTNLPLIGKGELPQPGKPVPLEMKRAMADFIQDNQSAIRFFDEATQFQQSRYPIDLSQGLMPLLPHLAKLRNAAKVLEISAISHAIVGQGKEAGNDLLASIAMSQSLDSEPVLVSQLVRVALIEMTVSELEQVLNRIVLPGETLNQLEVAFQRSEKREAAGFGFTRAFVGEETMDLSAFGMSPDQYLRIPTDATPTERTQLEAKIKKTLADDRQFCEATFNQALVVRKEPLPRRLTQQDELFSHAEAMAKNKNLFLSAIFLKFWTKSQPKKLLVWQTCVWPKLPLLSKNSVSVTRIIIPNPWLN
ncbi:MAG TPA: hypothetical protein VMA13_02410 [Candidatus Saccharimonadales bacterium]|nr:hypothetical protein [Candidatus Saccharimonadales bacterium]